MINGDCASGFCCAKCRYELCNQHGIYLVDEANVETHGFEPSFSKKNAHPACWPEWHDAIVDRGVRMVCLSITLISYTICFHKYNDVFICV